MTSTPLRSPALVLATAAAAAWLTACSGSDATDASAAPAHVVMVSVVSTHATSPADRPDDLQPEQIERTVAAELERRSLEERTSRAIATARSSDRTTRLGAATVGPLPASEETWRRATAPAGTPSPRPVPTDRFRAIPLERRPASSQPQEQPTRERFRRIPLVVPQDTVLEIELVEALSSQTSSVGDLFTARVVSPVSVDGYFAVPLGATVVGHVEAVDRARRFGGRARLLLLFDRLVLPEGEVPLEASLYDEARGETGRDAATIAGATAAGAILGRAVGDGDRRSAVGALIGAAIGTGVAARRGEAIELPAGGRLTLALDEPVEVTVRVRVLEVG